MTSAVLRTGTRPGAEHGANTADDGLMTAYQHAVASYVRRPYSGRVAVFWPDEVPVNTLGGPQLQWSRVSDPTLGWRQVAADLEVYTVPGDYTTSVTTHVHHLAEVMSACVQRARAAPG